MQVRQLEKGLKPAAVLARELDIPSRMTPSRLGYIADPGVERIYRNLRGGRMMPISDEMVLNTVAQHDLGMPRSY